ncbi:MAG: chemotaxis protein CheX, partial [Candidatus Glassbacteria bacterium]|nr:chemotaxis protein CheX [Candidatus Glassbacteria bacterium]
MNEGNLSALESFGQSVSQVLEQMAFMFSDPADPEMMLEDPGDCYLVQMSYLGPCSGKVAVAVQADLGREVGSNMLGADLDQVTDTMVGDALKEMLNMSCGQFLTSYYGNEPVFDLTVPEISRLDTAAWKELAAGPDNCLYEVDEYQYVVSVEPGDKG